jgi:hypothetical protein
MVSCLAAPQCGQLRMDSRTMEFINVVIFDCET